MKADVSYNDFIGTAAADISDFEGKSDDVNDFARFFNLDTNRFKIVGISIYGTEDFHISLLCVDNEKSTKSKEHIVSMSYDLEIKDILSVLFKRLNIVLYGKFDEKYPNLSYDEEVRYTDFHKIEEENSEKN